jgi:hypothetical protein
VHGDREEEQPEDERDPPADLDPDRQRALAAQGRPVDPARAFAQERRHAHQA